VLSPVSGGLNLLIDCGLYQERKFQPRNWVPLPVDLKSIDFVLLTHAHLDHTGRIPLLTRNGYNKPILATPPTIDLATIVLEDAGYIQEEDAEYKRRRHRREGRKSPHHPIMPLYTQEDAKAAVKFFKRAYYNKPVQLNDSVTVRFGDAGHILGSSVLRVTESVNGNDTTIAFSGDVGQYDSPLMRDPDPVERADYVVMESTYGDRMHKPADDMLTELARIVNETVQRGGHVVIPTFAIDRAQDLLYYISTLVREDRIPDIGIALDSPMAINATTIYKRHRNLFDEETQKRLGAGDNPFHFDGLRFTRTRQESQSLNSLTRSSIIMAGSGMCTGGRIKHHLRNNLERPESTILFVGYQAPGTLGRHIVNRPETVRIHGRYYEVRAHIEQLQGLSAHADQKGLLRWLQSMPAPPKRVFLTHGDLESAQALAGQIHKKCTRETAIPEFEEVVELN
jgi:metallo-beta-lactamase family protein